MSYKQRRTKTYSGNLKEYQIWLYRVRAKNKKEALKKLKSSLGLSKKEIEQFKDLVKEI